MLKNGCYLLCFVLLVCHKWSVNGGVQEESWVEPHSWGHLDDWNGQLAQDVCKPCNPQHDSLDDTVALIYLRKFIATLFSRNHLQYDESAQLYKRTLTFQLLPSELDALENKRDPRDLDIILTKIFENVRLPPRRACNSAGEKSVFALIWEIIKDFMQLLKISEIQFVLFVVIATMIGWFVHRRYRIRPLIILFGGIFIFGYFVTYFECNRKIAADELIEMLDDIADSSTVVNLPWYSRLKNYVFSIDPVVVAQKTKIRKSSKVNLAFCRPDHVMMMYMNDLFVKQVEFMIEKCSAAFSNLTSQLYFPYNYLAPFALILMIAYMLKLTFKYILSPKAWATLLHAPNFRGGHTQQEAIIMDSTTDRVSGENLKMLLNVIHTSTTVSLAHKQQFPLVSGVQEVLERVEAPPTPAENSSPDTTDSSICETKSASPNEIINDAQGSTLSAGSTCPATQTAGSQ